MKKLLLAVFLFALSAIPAAAGSITIDSTNCNSGKGCYGLTWTLNVYGESHTVGPTTYAYVATLTVTDDAAVNTASQTISAVTFKASNDITGIDLISMATGWTDTLTGFGPLTGGSTCSDGNTDFGCSQTATAITTSANPTGSYVWTWYFNSTDPTVGVIGDDMHIGAKMTTLDQPGKLLSASTTVPEPSSLSLLGVGVAGLFANRRRRKTS